MGAEDQWFTIKGGNEKYVRTKVEQKCEDDKHEYGHGGYTGTWAEWNGRVVFHNKKFKSKDEAHEYLFGYNTGKGVVQKWDDAIAVEYRNEAGQLVWLVGATFSC